MLGRLKNQRRTNEDRAAQEDMASATAGEAAAHAPVETTNHTPQAALGREIFDRVLERFSA